ncbi:hypothetical protein B0T24DRAFT_618824 [Lasiosphaeria ovina]|uniref:SET domain-containing protein n=1 Tax=Lasiosphaeria ovina TaxID=92902 RepID=A0AAE0KHU7_9PEZI|nr:hypothetical protein B0T24DRAFT_618824 [Lasiosphaeria ovina]
MQDTKQVSRAVQVELPNRDDPRLDDLEPLPAASPTHYSLAWCGTHPAMKERDQSRFGALVSWAQQHGAELHPSLEVYCDPVTKFSIRAKEKEQLPAGEALLQPGFAAFSCPFSITLSYLNALPSGGSGTAGSSLGDSLAVAVAAFPPRFMATVPPHVIGRFFLMQQYLLGAESFWYPYIATLPQPEQPAAWALPAFWPDDDAAFLDGTNARVAVDEMQANARREFKQARKALKEDADMFPQWQEYTRLLYNWAFCIFTSRSFRPSLIASAHAPDAIAQALVPRGCGIDDFSVLQPLFDIANHSMTSRYTWDVSLGPPPCCRLVCLDAYGPGEQVYNNYGLKTNSELLLGYGFVVPETAALHNDYVHVRKRGGGGSDSSSESAGGGGDKPKDFLISLRPLTDPSSVVGRARPPPSCTLLSTSRGPLHLMPEFAHFEPALVYDLAEALSARPETLPAAAEEGRGADAQAVELVVEDEDALVGRIKEALAAKLQYDYQRLEEAVAAGGDGVEPANQNQQLAHEYRRQCGKVLLAALQSLAA